MSKTKSKKSPARSSSKKSKKTTSTVSALGTLTRTTDRAKLSQTTWVVFRGPSGERKPMLFNSKLTRDNVRGAYSKITGTTKERTRARRLMNY
jgi:hypothetical protein